MHSERSESLVASDLHFFITPDVNPRTRGRPRVVVGVDPTRSQRVSKLKLSRVNHPHALHYRATYDTTKLQDALHSRFLSDSPPSRFHISTQYHIPKSTFNDWCEKLQPIIQQCNTDDDKKIAIQHAIQSTHAGTSSSRDRYHNRGSTGKLGI